MNVILGFIVSMNEINIETKSIEGSTTTDYDDDEINLQSKWLMMMKKYINFIKTNIKLTHSHIHINLSIIFYDTKCVQQEKRITVSMDVDV